MHGARRDFSEGGNRFEASGIAKRKNRNKNNVNVNADDCTSATIHPAHNQTIVFYELQGSGPACVGCAGAVGAADSRRAGTTTDRRLRLRWLFTSPPPFCTRTRFQLRSCCSNCCFARGCNAHERRHRSGRQRFCDQRRCVESRASAGPVRRRSRKGESKDESVQKGTDGESHSHPTSLTLASAAASFDAA